MNKFTSQHLSEVHSPFRILYSLLNHIKSDHDNWNMSIYPQKVNFNLKWECNISVIQVKAKIDKVQYKFNAR